MSRFRSGNNDLAYGEAPERWDRDRFERVRVSERDRPVRTDIRIEDRIDSRGPRGRYEEHDFFEERDRYYAPPRQSSRPRRSDRELFGEEDPRYLADRALAPYRPRERVEREREIDIEVERIRRAPPPARPGLLRRQSSLDTFDRRPQPRYDRTEDYRVPRRSPPRRYREEEIEEIHYREHPPQDYRDVEILREREVIKRAGPKSVAESVRSEAKSRAKSAKSVKSAKSAKSVKSESSSSSSSSEEFEEASRASSPSPERKVGKKGKTRMPKRLVRKEAIINLGYSFEEEDDFIIVRRALEKEQIDEVIRISEQYKEPSMTTYRYEEAIAGAPPANKDHYETLRTEWINPPSVRAPSPARTARSRRASSPKRVVVRAASTVRAPSPRREEIIIEERPKRQEIVIEERREAPRRPEVVTIERQQQSMPYPPPPPPALQPLTVVLPERRERTARDLNAEIRLLEAEQRNLRHERESREIVVRRPGEDYEVVEFRPRGERRDVIDIVEREPKRETVRVEKDRKDRNKPNPKLVAAMLATLT